MTYKPKARRYQIVRRKPGQVWEFCAHGAIYRGEEGMSLERIIKENGGATRRLYV